MITEFKEAGDNPLTSPIDSVNRASNTVFCVVLDDPRADVHARCVGAQRSRDRRVLRAERVGSIPMRLPGVGEHGAGERGEVDGRDGLALSEARRIV